MYSILNDMITIILNDSISFHEEPTASGWLECFWTLLGREKQRKLFYQHVAKVYTFFFLSQSSLIDLSIFALVGGQALSVSVTAERQWWGGGVNNKIYMTTPLWHCNHCSPPRMGSKGRHTTQHTREGKTFYHPRLLLWIFSPFMQDLCMMLSASSG